MFRPICTAVVASVFDRVRTEAAELLSRRGVKILAGVRDGVSAYGAVEEMRPDLLVTDALLPGIGGAVLAVRVLYARALPVCPRVMLVSAFEEPMKDELSRAGAAVVSYPLRQDVFFETVEKLEHAPVFYTDERAAFADRILDALGMPDHPGRGLIKRAALYLSRDERFLCDLRGSLYSLAAQDSGMDLNGAERAMRHAIYAAWRSNQFENQHRIFADTVDEGRGEPTLGEMIARLADILRLEG